MIPIDEHELTINHTTKQCRNFMEHVEAKIDYSEQPLFYGMDTERLFYSDFGDTDNYDDMVLPQGEDIKYQKYVEFNRDHIEELYNYIGAK